MKKYAAMLIMSCAVWLSGCGTASQSQPKPQQSGSAGISANNSESEQEINSVENTETQAPDGSEALQFSLPNLNSFTAQILGGGSFTEADLAGADITAVNIWSTTCGPCIREMPELAEYAKSLPENLRVMTWCLDAEVSPDGQQIQSFLNDCGFTGVTLTSGDGDMQTLLNQLMYTPTTVFIDGSGNLVCEPLVGAGDIKEKYTSCFNEGLKRLGKDTI